MTSEATRVVHAASPLPFSSFALRTPSPSIFARRRSFFATRYAQLAFRVLANTLLLAVAVVVIPAVYDLQSLSSKWVGGSTTSMTTTTGSLQTLVFGEKKASFLERMVRAVSAETSHLPFCATATSIGPGKVRSSEENPNPNTTIASNVKLVTAALHHRVLLDRRLGFSLAQGGRRRREIGWAQCCEPLEDDPHLEAVPVSRQGGQEEGRLVLRAGLLHRDRVHAAGVLVAELLQQVRREEC